MAARIIHTREQIELFKFTILNKEYRYTNAGYNYTEGSNQWNHLVIRRTETENPGNDSPNRLLQVEMDGLSEFVFDFDKVVESATIEVLKADAESNDLVQIHSGTISSIYWREGVRSYPLAVMSVETQYKSELSFKLPRSSYTPYCGVPLYSAACGVRKIFYTANSRVLNSGNIRVNLNSDLNTSFYRTSSPPRDYFTGGSITRVKTGSVREITFSQGRTIDILYPFFELEDGDQMEITAGCNHTTQECHSKFNNNLDNIRNFPNVPEIDSTLETIEEYKDNKPSQRDPNPGVR